MDEKVSQLRESLTGDVLGPSDVRRLGLNRAVSALAEL
jgi:hypothetical protein